MRRAGVAQRRLRARTPIIQAGGVVIQRLRPLCFKIWFKLPLRENREHAHSRHKREDHKEEGREKQSVGAPLHFIAWSTLVYKVLRATLNSLCCPDSRRTSRTDKASVETASDKKRSQTNLKKSLKEEEQGGALRTKDFTDRRTPRC
jgi:hypothetical protein